MESIINKNGVEVKVGDYWTMERIYDGVDTSWIMRIENIQVNGLVPVKYVNFKRKGKGLSYSRMVDDFGLMGALRRSTDKEIYYFNIRK